MSIRKLTRSIAGAIAVAGLFAVGAPAMAQDESENADGWQFLVAPYLLFPHMSGEVTVKNLPVETEVGPSDIFEKLDFGAMLYLEMANRNWAISLDGLYMNLGDDGQTPVTQRATNIDMFQIAVQANGLRRIQAWAEIGIGVRVNVLDTTLKVAPGQVLPGQEVSGNHTWVDPLIAARFMTTGDGPWRLGVSGDVGGFGIASDYAWQIAPLVGYRFSKLFELAAAYRWIGMRYETGSGSDRFVYDMTIFGPEIGLLFHF